MGFIKLNNANYANFPKLTLTDLQKSSTPFFLSDASIIKLNFKSLQNYLDKSWGPNHQIAYSFKTNYACAETLKQYLPSINAEVVSEKEYKLAKSLNYADSEIIYNGPYKANLNQVLSSPAIINLDNFNEIKQIIHYKNPIKSKLGLRLNSTLKPSRFGFNIENGEAQKAIYQLLKNNIKICGFHIHLGFYTHPKIYKFIAQKLIKLIDTNKIKIEYIDFGGGFPSHGLKPYEYKKNTYHDINDYTINICKTLNNYYSDLSKPKLIFEPGRYLIDDSTALISKVVDVKILKNKQIITVDTNNHSLSSVWFRPQIIEIFKPRQNKLTDTIIDTIIYGNTCQENDILFQGKISMIDSTDFIIFHCVGAYNQNMEGNFIYNQTNHFIKKLK